MNAQLISQILPKLQITDLSKALNPDNSKEWWTLMLFPLGILLLLSVTQLVYFLIRDKNGNSDNKNAKVQKSINQINTKGRSPQKLQKITLVRANSRQKSKPSKAYSQKGKAQTVQN